MYNGKTVLVTGSSKGIGRSLVDHFLDNRAEVIGVSHTTELSTNYYRHWKIDLSNPEETEKSFSSFINKILKIDILINNAAVLTSQYAMRMKIEDAKNMVNVDLLAPFIATKICSKIMQDIPYGRIINIGSMATALEPMGDSMYAACKSGLMTMGNIMAKEFSSMNITINTLAISAFHTDMTAQLNQEKLGAVVKSLPIPRFAELSDIINVVDFFCSKRSSYITAQTIYLGGVH